MSQENSFLKVCLSRDYQECLRTVYEVARYEGMVEFPADQKHLIPELKEVGLVADADSFDGYILTDIGQWVWKKAEQC